MHTYFRSQIRSQMSKTKPKSKPAQKSKTRDKMSPVSAQAQQAQQRHDLLHRELLVLAEDVSATREKTVPKLYEMFSLLSQRCKNYVKGSRLLSWSKFKNEYAKKLEVTMRTISRWILEFSGESDAPEPKPKDKPFRTTAAQTRQLVAAATVANELVEAVEHGGDVQTVLKEYKRVAVTPSTLDNYVNQLSTRPEPDWKATVQDTVSVMETEDHISPRLQKLLDGLKKLLGVQTLVQSPPPTPPTPTTATRVTPEKSQEDQDDTLAPEPGPDPEPPTTPQPESDWSTSDDPRADQTLEPPAPTAPEPAPAVDGLTYIESFLPADEQQALLAELDKLTYAQETKMGNTTKWARVQFGYEYGSTSRKLASTKLYPAFLFDFERKVRAACGESVRFDQCIITRYPARAGIGWHTDAPSFGDCICGVSLGAPARLQFRRPPTPPEKTAPVEYEVTPVSGSLYVMRGSARWGYQHRVPKVRDTRYSLTFRVVEARAGL